MSFLFFKHAESWNRFKFNVFFSDFFLELEITFFLVGEGSLVFTKVSWMMAGGRWPATACDISKRESSPSLVDRFLLSALSRRSEPSFFVRSLRKRWVFTQKTHTTYMAVSENSGFSPQIIHFNRVFHDFHHPFWGVFPLFFGVPPIYFRTKSTFPGFPRVLKPPPQKKIQIGLASLLGMSEWTPWPRPRLTNGCWWPPNRV